MNNKAIMTSFLITVILALIIFVPTCYGISKLFRLSDQAKGSFIELGKNLEQLPSLEHKKKSEIIILDKDTLLIGFNAQQKVQYCAATNDCGEVAYPIECEGKACLCLCREYSYSGNLEGEDLICSERLCETVDGIKFADQLGMSNFYLTPENLILPHLAQGYFKNGFILTRGNLEFLIGAGGVEVSHTTFHFEPFRRQFFFLTASGNTISLCRKEEGCKP